MSSDGEFIITNSYISALFHAEGYISPELRILPEGKYINSAWHLLITGGLDITVRTRPLTEKWMRLSKGRGKIVDDFWWPERRAGAGARIKPTDLTPLVPRWYLRLFWWLSATSREPQGVPECLVVLHAGDQHALSLSVFVWWVMRTLLSRNIQVLFLLHPVNVLLL